MPLEQILNRTGVTELSDWPSTRTHDKSTTIGSVRLSRGLSVREASNAVVVAAGALVFDPMQSSQHS